MHMFPSRELSSCHPVPPGGDLRGGWGTPVYHLSHLDFWKRLEHLGFAYRLFPGAPSSDFMHRVFSATLPLADES
eukprot:g153.t1